MSTYVQHEAKHLEKLWLSGEDLCDWIKGNITPIYNKGKKEEQKNCRPVSLCLGRSWDRSSWKTC